MGSFQTITTQGTSGSTTSSSSSVRSRTGAVVLMAQWWRIHPSPGQPPQVPEADGDAAAIQVLQQRDGAAAGGAERLLGLGGREPAAAGEGAAQLLDRPFQGGAAQVQPGGDGHQHPEPDQH